MIVNITDKAELSFYPNSFANLSDKDKETLAAKEAARIQKKVEARQKKILNTSLTISKLNLSLLAVKIA